MTTAEEPQPEGAQASVEFPASAVRLSLARGESVIKYKSPLNVLKYTYNSCY